MKITVVSYEDPTKSSTWSGTTANMYKALKNNKTIDTVDTIKLSGKYTSLIKKITSYYYKIFLNQKIANFETTSIGMKYWGNKLNRAIKKQKIKSDFYFLPAGAAAIAGSKTSKKLVYLPDATFALMNKDYYYSNTSSKAANIGNSIDLLAMKKAYKIIVPSDWCYKSIITDYGQSQHKTKLIEFGANLPHYSQNLEKKLNSNTIKLLLVGVDYKRKGVNTAIKTIDYLNTIDTEHSYRLTIIGLEKPKNLNNKNVIFKGKLVKENPKELSELENEYKKSDLFILPTRAEAAGIVFAEAQMFSLPIITYSTGGIKNYVKNTITGYTLKESANYKDFAKKVLEIVQNPVLYSKMSYNARKNYMTRLNWNVWANKVLLDL
ncbi:glycosyltransferase family 4 protein [Limosilactobacillus reuteri subsp. suis]|uniref:glycosyltransferase family 4 protein n=1 Tax=Limosilactobacillus reuteri TaxID=1598 RepID=UPI003995C6FA